MRLYTLLLLILLHVFTSYANDGAYTGSGNHLIPITENEISVKKEILTISLVDGKAKVDVYYEMFNPGKEKTVMVGFEAPSPGGDVKNELKNDGHPYLSDFTVKVNDQITAYNINYFIKSDSENERSMNVRDFKQYIASNYDTPYTLSYVFSATFKKGINIIKHTYDYELSSNTALSFSFDYILTAANRWANKGIDDFTLNINTGTEQYMAITPTFFSKTTGWNINGKGMMAYGPKPNAESTKEKALWFFVEDGFIQFKKKNFHPKAELEFSKPSDNSEEVNIMKWVDKQLSLMKKKSK
jgi:hypothetical protein